MGHGVDESGRSSSEAGEGPPAVSYGAPASPSASPSSGRSPFGSSPLSVPGFDGVEDTPAEIPSPGRNFGDYELLEQIGRGRTGILYTARLRGDERVVALKMIISGRLASDNDLGRFRADAEAASRLDHPLIVPLFDFGEFDGQEYCSMGYVEGETLEVVLQSGPLRPAAAVRLVRSLAEGVQYAHEQDVTHRALTPARVIIAPGAPPRITGFGLARWIDADSGLASGKDERTRAGYLAPEQVTLKTRDGVAVDVYGLGAILFATLTGRPPFRAGTRAETLRQVRELPPPRPGRFNDAIAPELEAICLRCLSKEPGDRYPSALALANELARWLKEGNEWDGGGAAETEKTQANQVASPEELSVLGQVMTRLAGVQMLVALGLEALHRHLPQVPDSTLLAKTGLIGAGLLLSGIIAIRTRLRAGIPVGRLEQAIARVGLLCATWSVVFIAAGVRTGAGQTELVTLGVLSVGLVFGSLGAVIEVSWFAPALAALMGAVSVGTIPDAGPFIAAILFSLGLFAAGRRLSRLGRVPGRGTSHPVLREEARAQTARVVGMVVGSLALFFSAPVFLWGQAFPGVSEVPNASASAREASVSPKESTKQGSRRIADSRFTPEARSETSGRANVTVANSGSQAPDELAAERATTTETGKGAVPVREGKDIPVTSLQTGNRKYVQHAAIKDVDSSAPPGISPTEGDSSHGGDSKAGVPVIARFAVINFLTDQGIPAFATERAPPGIGSDPATGEILAERLQDCQWLGGRERAFSMKPGRMFRYIQCWSGPVKVEGWVSQSAFDEE